MKEQPMLETPTEPTTPGPDVSAPVGASSSAKRHQWTRDEIIEAIRGYAAEHGLTPLARDVGLAAQAAKRHFGSWGAAIEAAGYPRPPERGRYDRTVPVTFATSGTVHESVLLRKPPKPTLTVRELVERSNPKPEPAVDSVLNTLVTLDVDALFHEADRLREEARVLNDKAAEVDQVASSVQKLLQAAT